MNRFKLFTDDELRVLGSVFDRFSVTAAIAKSAEPETTLVHEFNNEIGSRRNEVALREQRDRIRSERDDYRQRYEELAADLQHGRDR